MKKRALGRTGLSVSAVGFGAWALGGTMWGGRRDDDGRAALRRAIERGVDFVDTALIYGNGHSERLVGEVLRDFRGVTVATKVPPKSMQWPARPNARLGEFFPSDWIVTCCDSSLKNLGREQVDLLQLHVWADAWTDEDEWKRALDDLKAAGKIRYAGVSINSHDPKSAVRLVRSGQIDALQVFYNLFDQSPEDELFPACLEHGVGVLARVPFDEGSLTGKLRHDTKFPEGDFRSEYFRGDLLHRTVDAVEKLRPIVEGAAGTMASSPISAHSAGSATRTRSAGFAIQSDRDLDVVGAGAAERSAFAAQIDLYVRGEIARRADMDRAGAGVDARFPRLAEVLRIRRWDRPEIARRRRDDRAGVVRRCRRAQKVRVVATEERRAVDADVRVRQRRAVLAIDRVDEERRFRVAAARAEAER
jgi:aryl-alcohol dehydrogenase-like predicted oxidoreductase